VNSQDVAIVLACEECGARWLPSDPERWRAMFLDDGPEEFSGFGARSAGCASSPEQTTSEVGTGVGTTRACATSPTRLSRATMRLPRNKNE
jgi:hypothetical protein